MSTADVDLVLAPPAGPLSGIGNLVRKELGSWWRTRMWWVQLILWLLLLSGVSTVAMLDPSLTDDAALTEAVQTFLLAGATAVGIAVVVTVQGAIVGEVELGTAAWVMSKPVSRAAFVLSKMAGHAVGFAVTALVVPAVVFAITVNAVLPRGVSPGAFGIGVAVVALALLFYLALTLALGTLFAGRGPVAGIGIALLLIGLFLKGMLPAVLVYATPWLLGDVAVSIALGQPLDPMWWVPVVATSIATVALVAVAVWRFGHEEF